MVTGVVLLLPAHYTTITAIFQQKYSKKGGWLTDEDRLLKSARRGDADAFEKLFAPLEGLAYHHALSMLKNPEDARDAAQEAMLRAYRGLTGYRGGSGLATWLYRITHNVCLDMLKKRGGRADVSLDELSGSGFDFPAADAPPDEALESRERAARVWKAVSGLPGDMRALIYLRHARGMSYEEIARAEGISLGTVKSRLSRARERLKKLLPDI